MRLPRTSLLARLTDAGAPWFVVLEAPTGFGKSWLLRKAAPPGAIRLRGELGPIADNDDAPTTAVIIDDAHLLSAADVQRLAEFVEDEPSNARLIVSGRILDDRIHDVAHLVDGLLLDASALAISAEEITEEVPNIGPAQAAQLVDATDGCVRFITSAIDQARLEPSSDPVAIAFRTVRSMGLTATQQLDSNDVGLVGLIARAPGIDQSLVSTLGGPGFVDRVLAAGVPLRRQVTGAIDVVAESAFRSIDVDPAVASRLSSALVDRDRPIEAIGLLLDAGAHGKAARLLADLPDSMTLTVDPREMLGLLARLGTIAESDPSLLLLRSTCSAVIGLIDNAGADIERANALVGTVESPLRRRVNVELAEWLLNQGRRDEAVEAAETALRNLGPGEDRTFARAHVVLAHGAVMSNDRASLQRAAEWYRVAAAAWDSCGEAARARRCRCDLATGVLVLLGRYDEALAQLAQILSASDLTDAERAWMVVNDGFVLYNANRLDAAEARFERASDLGYVQGNPRIIAAAAWGRALVCARLDDVDGLLRWIATTENTALGAGDDVLGVPFHCDMSTVLGAVGELELAERHLQSARERSPLYTDEIAYAAFLLECRHGRVGDVSHQLDSTPPSEAWRVELVSAYATALAGDLTTAHSLLAQAERDLVALGFSDFAALGEGRIHRALKALIAATEPEEILEPVASTPAARAAAPARQPAGRRRLRVVGGPLVIEDGDASFELPPGNPQRLVGVVVAHGGVASFDQLSEAIWPGDDVEASRARLRNVLLRLRRGAGDVIVRSGSGVRLAPGVECDIYEFERLATDALSSARADPEFAGQLAAQAVRMVDGPIFGDFEYEEWAMSARESVERKLIGLLDLLSVQAEDSGDLALAQSLAERALRLDRYTDSRYVRLAELLTMQGRTAAAVAVLEDAAGAARDMGSSIPDAVKSRRDDLIRRASGNG